MKIGDLIHWEYDSGDIGTVLQLKHVTCEITGLKYVDQALIYWFNMNSGHDKIWMCPSHLRGV